MAISASTNTRMAAGCSRFIVKPIHLDELLKSIETDLKLVWEKQKPETESPALTIDDLSDEQRSTLRDMASDGDISAILDWCMNASGQEPRYDAAIKKVEKLARQFKVNEIKRLVTMANKGE